MSAQPPLRLCFVPFYGARSHTIPILGIARYLAFHGQKITLLATPSNGKFIGKLLNNDTVPSDKQISLRIIPMPFKEVGLPEDYDELNEPQDIPTTLKLYRTKDLLRHTVQQFLEAEVDRFDCIIVDSMYPWTADVAAHIQIPCISFNAYSVFSHCGREAIRSPDSPHRQVESQDEPFVLPGLPVPVTMTKSELPPDQFLAFQEPLRTGELKCDLIVTNTFLELESAFIEYFYKVTGSKIIPIGPSSEIIRKISGGVERGKEMENKHECLSWLDSQKPNSILYVNFGSMVKFPDAQLMEIASALESFGCRFLWVALGKEDEKEEEGKWLPIGFHLKIKDRGLLVKSWAPQPAILEHPSVGGFMTHCGWNSLLEGFTAGLPMITWPFTYDQFYNEKLATQVVGVGVELGGLEWDYYFNVGKKIVKREKIEVAVRKLMEGGEKTEEMRKKAQECKKLAKAAVQEGGSTHRAMLNLIEEVRKLKDVKANTNKTNENSRS